MNEAETRSKRQCLICDDPDMNFAWTDTHGIAQCFKCGTPYRLYHYEGEEGNRRRIEKPHELMIKPEYVSVCRAYWLLHGRRMPSGFSMAYDQGYELATKEDAEAFNRYAKANPPQPTPAGTTFADLEASLPAIASDKMTAEAGEK